MSIWLVIVLSAIGSCSETGPLPARPADYGKVVYLDSSSLKSSVPKSVEDIFRSGAYGGIAWDSVMADCLKGPCDQYGEGQVLLLSVLDKRKESVSQFRMSKYPIVRAISGSRRDHDSICQNGSLEENLLLVSSCSIQRINQLIQASLMSDDPSYLKCLRSIVNWMNDPQADYLLSRLESLASISQFRGEIDERLCFVEWTVREINRRAVRLGLKIDLPIPKNWESYWGGAAIRGRSRAYQSK